MSESFRKRHKISTMKLLWDKTGISWTKLGIPAQPAWMFINANGNVVGTDLGAIPYQDVAKEL